MRSPRTGGTVLALALLSDLGSARAYEERATLELQLAPGLWLAPAVAGQGAAGVGFTWGLGQSWAIGGELRYALAVRDAAVHQATATFDVIYVLDIVTVVPRLALGVGPALLHGGDPAFAIAGHAAVGFDRHVDFGIVGLDLRCDLTAPVQPSGSAVVALSVALRIGWLFDRF